jgi:hypothetical protein
VSPIIDVIAVSPAVVLRADGIAVSRCFRHGKGAFVAGALDDQIASTLPIESGIGIACGPE